MLLATNDEKPRILQQRIISIILTIFLAINYYKKEKKTTTWYNLTFSWLL